MEVLAIVPARGGSKGIYKKNLALCAGKPLIQWTCEAILESRMVTTTLVSSDDLEILQAADVHRSGFILAGRPPYLATDEASTESVLGYYLNHREADIIVLLQPTSPVRTGAQIDEAVKLLIDQEFDSVVSVVPAHPFIWFNNGQETLAAYDYQNRRRRQDLPPTYEENGSIYVFTREHWEKSHNRLGGEIGMYVMGEESRIQIDTPLDLFLVEQILLRREAHANG